MLHGVAPWATADEAVLVDFAVAVFERVALSGTPSTLEFWSLLLRPIWCVPDPSLAAGDARRSGEVVEDLVVCWSRSLPVGLLEGWWVGGVLVGSIHVVLLVGVLHLGVLLDPRRLRVVLLVVAATTTASRISGTTAIRHRDGVGSLSSELARGCCCCSCSCSCCCVVRRVCDFVVINIDIRSEFVDHMTPNAILSDVKPRNAAFWVDWGHI